MLRRRLRQICSIVDKVLCEARRREKVCSRRMRKGRTWSDSVLCSGKSGSIYYIRIVHFILLKLRCLFLSTTKQHGGGVRCKLAGCNRVAIGKLQLCRTHGGGSTRA